VKTVKSQEFAHGNGDRRHGVGKTDDLPPKIGKSLDLRLHYKAIDRRRRLSDNGHSFGPFERGLDQEECRRTRNIDCAPVQSHHHIRRAALDRNHLEIDPLAGKKAFALSDVKLERRYRLNRRRNLPVAQSSRLRSNPLNATYKYQRPDNGNHIMFHRPPTTSRGDS